MSYEPILIFEEKNLEKLRTEVAKTEYEIFSNSNSKKKNELIEFNSKMAYELRTCSTFKFKKLKLVMIHPELSSFNEKVRKFLEKNEVEFAEIN